MKGYALEFIDSSWEINSSVDIANIYYASELVFNKNSQNNLYISVVSKGL